MPLIGRRWFVLGSAAALAVARLKLPADTTFHGSEQPRDWASRTRRIADWSFGFGEATSQGELQLLVGDRRLFRQMAGPYAVRWTARQRLHEMIVLPNEPVTWQLALPGDSPAVTATHSVIWHDEDGRAYQELITWIDGKAHRADFLQPLDTRWPPIRNVA